MEQVQRMCQVCRNRFNKKDLNRFVFDKNQLFVDNQKKHNGKACYVCKNKTCLDSILKKKVFNRIYKTNFDTNQYENILKEIELANTTNKKN